MTTPPSPTPYQSALHRDGFVVIPALLTPPEITHYRRIATAATQLTRTGQWPYFRTVPKQFPPWPRTLPAASDGGIWGVQHLLHPDMPHRTEFARFYFSAKVLAVAEELLGISTPGKAATGNGNGNGNGNEPEPEPLVMELFNLLVAPETHDFALRWHRDDIPEHVSADEELRLLQTKSPQGRQSHAQYNLALCEDRSLVVVPGSHRRVRTPTERAADPYAAELPGQVVVTLHPGDAVFYDSNILHRGVYRAKVAGAGVEEEPRLTLHGSLGWKGSVDGGGQGDEGKSAAVRATAVLQHGVGAWVQREDAAFGIGERPERMRANLVAMGSGEGVGFSLQG
ncbi:phytanoyl-CoA dioxygenase family protein [Aspergillus brunneoviolaceus CBS 621.78]|uniref:Phytanoyl-CoA dioxygenase family protein n=1 Tax=Aspergillus brunneoviolaceus CBS 621.78 TaxID=1450534 RepID=A0ACD1GKH9_9EURO|nr:phytanoyl-CoA dioxygenase family protein [Aspergillus brunneoviolaceus CBS 621.78]RAH49794.1 phytanoyl-CoA dioxygenase family protein [Aspergillus brunneoviolaceus CBS 621.78]